MSARTLRYSDEDFRRRWAIGHRWAEYVAEELRARGWHVEPLPPPTFRADASEISGYTRTEVDLVAEGRVVEVKARSVEFTRAEDFPYETALVDTVKGFDAKRRRPACYMIVSTYTQAIVWFPARRELFEVVTQSDPARTITYDAYVISKEHLRNLRERRDPR